MTIDAATILIVEDDDSIREALSMLLESFGYVVHQASDGATALEWLATEVVPRVIIADMMMPNVSGEEFVLTLKRSGRLRSVPIVVLSGHTSARKKAESLGADACLIKPVEVDELLALVEKFTK